MKKLSALIILMLMVGILSFFTACGEKKETAPATGAEKVVKQTQQKEVDVELQKEADLFLKEYLADFLNVYKAIATAYWEAANSGKKEDFEAYATADLEFKKLHSDKARYETIAKLIAQKEKLEPLTARSLEVAYLSFKGNQLPKELLEKMVKMSSEIEEIFNVFRGKVDGKEYSNNDLLEMIKKETDSAKREKIWSALKQVGDAMGPKLVALAKVRNEAAKSLGYKNFWDMEIRLQEHDPDQLIKIFNDLEKSTDEPFKQMKAQLDAQLAKRYNIEPSEMMPWHYDNPFFQAAPPSDKVALDEFYEKKTKEEIVELARRFYSDIGLPIDEIIARSDLYEREGKHQHAFCTSLDLNGDTRVLVNIKPTAEWMDTMLHEMGHGIYDQNVDFTLPVNLREPAHAFTTEAIAMLFGALAKNPVWLVSYAGADQKRVLEIENAILEQRRREQLIFARWSLVMFNFEKALYENPEQDFNTLWWDMAERYQMLKRPEGRNAADWAAKPHFTIAPVYYHNYMLGELLSAQLRHTLVKLAKHEGPAYKMDYSKQKEFGNYFKTKIFKPADTKPWPEFVKDATGEELNPQYFANELK